MRTLAVNRQLASNRSLWSGFAIQPDGSQSYASLGTLGNFGSNLGSGFYCSFQIKTTQTTEGYFFGEFNEASSQEITVLANQAGNGIVTIYMQDANNKSLSAQSTSATNINNGSVHSVVVTIIPSTNTITLSIDGSSIPITYTNQHTPATFNNFTSSFYLGGESRYGLGNPIACTLDNFQIGTSSSNLYGQYMGIYQKGTGTTLHDSSGNGNDGTLEGSPVPPWVLGFGSGARFNLASGRSLHP